MIAGMISVLRRVGHFIVAFFQVDPVYRNR